MPIFDLALPDGRTLTLEAPDQNSAMTAAQMWHSQNPPMSGADRLADVAKSAGTGLVNAATGMAGLPGDIQSMVGSAGRWMAGRNDLPVTGPQLPGSQDISSKVQEFTGPLHQPQTTEGRFAKTIGEFAPGAALPGSAMRRVVGNVVAPAVGSEVAGMATKGTEAEPYARVAGAVVGGMAPTAAARTVTPLPSSATRQNAVNVLRNEGVTDLTPGQITGNRSLQYFESEQGGQRAANMGTNAQEQFTAAALRRAGETGNRATTEVVDRAFTRIGRNFDDLMSRNSIQVDTNTWNRLNNVRDEYFVVTPPSQRAPVIEALVKDIGDAAVNNRGVLQGDVYKELRTRIGSLERGTQDNTLREALRGMREAIDDAMQRTPWVSQADKTAWQTARREYRNMMVIERAATGGGADTASGLLSPAQLRVASVAQNRRGYARGQGEFSDLVHAGNEVMTPLPNSGTAPRMRAQSMGVGLPGAIGATLGGSAGAVLGNPTLAGFGAGAGAIAGMAVPPLIARGMLSDVGRAWLTNNALGPAGVRPGTLQQGLLNSILARPQSQSVLAIPGQ